MNIIVISHYKNYWYVYPGLKLYFEKKEKDPEILKLSYVQCIVTVFTKPIEVVCNTVTKIEGDKNISAWRENIWRNWKFS